METNNYRVYVARNVNKQLPEVCSMIGRQTITGCMYHDR